jgi:hypothetical protein
MRATWKEETIMAKRMSSGGLVGLALAALCFAVMLFLFQAHASATEGGLFIAQSASIPAR